MPPMPMAMSAYAQYGAAVPVAVPAFMLPIVTAGLWWACVGKWQGFIALLLLTAYLGTCIFTSETHLTGSFGQRKMRRLIWQLYNYDGHVHWKLFCPL